MSYLQRYSYVPVVVPVLQNLKIAKPPKKDDDDECATTECCDLKYPSDGSKRDICVFFA